MSQTLPTAVAMLSGGLDSTVAAGILQRQGIGLIGLHIHTPFACGAGNVDYAAELLGIPYETRTVSEDYLNLWRRPRFGFGRGANPCVDCHLHMFMMAHQMLDETDASFVVSGEVLGQKPHGQKRQALLAIEVHSGLRDQLLRPLSARLLPPTLVETTGIVDRDALCDFSGKSRRPIEALAIDFGWNPAQLHSTGCRLRDATMSAKVAEMFANDDNPSLWSAGLVHLGRHFRTTAGTKIIASRNSREAEQLSHAYRSDISRSSILVEPVDFAGPTVLLFREDTEVAIALIARLANNAAGNSVSISDWRVQGDIRHVGSPHLAVNLEQIGTR